MAKRGTETLSIILVALVTVEHLYILALEMFLWEKYRAQKYSALKKKILK